MVDEFKKDDFQSEGSRVEKNQRQTKKRRRRRTILLVVIAILLILALAAAAYAWMRWDSVSSFVGLDSGEATVTDARSASAATAGTPTAAGAHGDLEMMSTTSSAIEVGRSLSEAIICIDPGHASNPDSDVEPIGPGSSEMKIKDPGGTAGASSGISEHVVTLAISQYLREMLEDEGIQVVMIRESDTYFGGNRERVQVANQAGADLFIRIHCDGSEDATRQGISTLYPAAITGWTDEIYVESKRAAESVHVSMINSLGAVDHGTVERVDITGFNWADVPTILTEVGFLSNTDDDALLASAEYQQQVARAIFEGIKQYLSSTA